MTDSVMQGVAEGMLAGTVLTNIGSAGTRAAQVEILLKQVEMAEERADKAEKRARKAEDENEMLKERIEQLERQQANQADIGILIANGPASSNVKEDIKREIAMAHEMIDVKSALRKKEEELHIKEQEFLEFFAANGALKKVIRADIQKGLKSKEEAQEELDRATVEYADELGGKIDNTASVKNSKNRLANKGK